MDRSPSSSAGVRAWLPMLFVLAVLPATTGCLHMLVATGVYMLQGGNLAPAECQELKDRKVVVFCRPPASHEYRHAGAARHVASRVSDLLEMNVTGVDVISQKQVDQWIDENDSDDYEELGRAVEAELVVRVELGHFELFSGPNVYQGNADVTVNVYDMTDGGRLLWGKPLGEVLYPVNGGLAIQDKSVSAFQREFVEIVASAVAKHFYPHDPTATFAMDALANR